ncbi:MAG: TonB-dependent receptor [candidate division WOR-3 bacterium]|nr:TonB-dependent receptor [candidate division WOR-3 bacterium]
MITTVFYFIAVALLADFYECEKNQFTNLYSIDAELLECLPVADLQDVLLLVPGVCKDYKSLHIRGGTGNSEIAYYLDGIPITNPEQINLNGVERIIIQKSGFAPEYKDGFSGIVHIETKNSDALKMTYLTDDIITDDRLNNGFNQYGIYTQMKIKDRFKAAFLGKSFFTDVLKPGLYKVSYPGNSYNGLIHFMYNLKENKIGFYTIAFRDQDVTWHPKILGGNAYKYSAQRLMVRKKGKSIITTAHFSSGQKTTLSMKFLRNVIDSVYGNRDYAWEEDNDYRWYDDYRLKGEHLIEYLEKRPLREILVDSLMKYHQEPDRNSPGTLRNNPYGIRGIFYTVGDYPAWCYYKAETQQLLFELTCDLTRQNRIKFGIDYGWYEFNYYYNPLPHFSQKLWSFYELKPHTISGYVEDRLMTGKIGISAGMRLSYFDYGLYYPGVELDEEDTVNVLKKFYFSPRIGILLPVSRKFKIFFNGGEFYYEPSGYLERSVPGKVRSFELGSKFALGTGFIITTSLYQKYLYELLIQKVEDYHGSFPISYYYLCKFTDKGEVNGWEVCIDKSVGRWFTSGIGYNLQSTRQMQIYGYNFYYEFYPGGNDPIIGNPISISMDSPLDYDCRHNLKIYLLLRIPEDAHSIFKNSTLGVFFSFFSGLPYTPEDFLGNPLGDINSSRMQGLSSMDLKLLKKFKIGPLHPGFAIMVNNLLNTEQIIYVYPTTGKPDDHGDPEPQLDQFGWLSITSLYYSPQADYNHDGLITPVEMKDEYLKARQDYHTNPMHYTNPFRVRFGLNVEF